MGSRGTFNASSLWPGMTGPTGELIEAIFSFEDAKTWSSGLFWNAFMVDRQNLYFVASWDTAQMNDAEVETCCDCLVDVMRKLANEQNWDKTVGEVFDRSEF